MMCRMLKQLCARFLDSNGLSSIATDFWYVADSLFASSSSMCGYLRTTSTINSRSFVSSPDSHEKEPSQGLFTPPVAGAERRAAFVARALRGALPPVDLRAVCFVRAMRRACQIYSKQKSASGLN